MVPTPQRGRRRGRGSTLAAACLTSACLAAAFPTLIISTSAHAARQEPLPKELEGIGVDEKLGATVDAQAPFRDENGREVSLSTYLARGQPVILTLNYSDCPMLCSVQLNAFTQTLHGMAWLPGKQFQIVTISLDPTEKPERARQTKERYMHDLGRPGAEDGWHFLTGSEESIKRVAASVGYNYRYSEESKQYIHVPVVTLLTPSGRVSRYIYGIVYDASTLRLSLVEASEGKSVSTVDRLVLYCFHYDAAKGTYAPTAQNLMRLGGGLMVAVLVVGFGVAFQREARRRRRAAAGHGITDAAGPGALPSAPQKPHDDHTSSSGGAS